MSRDYKNIKSNKPDSKTKNSDNLFSFLIGIILGLFIAVIIYFNQNKMKYGENLLLDKKNNKETQSKDNETLNTKIIFDFPTILEERQVAKLAEKEYKEPEKNNSKSEAHTIYILQIGSFKKFKSADALKAKLAFLGLSAYIEKKDIMGKGINFRVLIGPFRDEIKMKKATSILVANNKNYVKIEQKIENKSM